ncbi:putative late blight resistance protein-like protein R1B-14 [Forsythia ovata]|uniref:Late blight resistance protein-like protein R1B-14 n=1 Tax=Forsythia ovata TaxID=205694 RepID=A0ABD1WP37_9LAMI
MNDSSISSLKISEQTEKILRSLPNLHKLKSRLGSSLIYSFDLLNRLESLNLSPDYSNAGDSCYSLISLSLNLNKMTLFDVHVSQKQMEIIGRLLYLEVRKVSLVAQLKFLKLDDIQLAEWNASSDYFLRLQLLVLRHFDHLKMIPSSLGDIPILQTGAELGFFWRRD